MATAFEWRLDEDFEPKMAGRASALLDRYASQYAHRVRLNMENSAASGRVYRRGAVSVEGGAQGGGYHRASAGGEPPAPDTRTLVDSIGWSGTGEGFKHEVAVGVTSPRAAVYVVALELGTARMLPRPVWLPTLQQTRFASGSPE